jgi:integrase
MTGMRRSEIAKLKWVNVDLMGKYIHVVETKNNESRSIPIAEQLLFVLKGLKTKSKSENVFNTHEGKPYTNESYWNRAWNTTLTKSGIDKCRFHDLRHTFTSRLIVDEKEDYVTVMALTGHKDISMLLRYSHTREEAKKSAINKISDLNYL